MPDTNLENSSSDAISVSKNPWESAQNAFSMHIYLMLAWMAIFFIGKSLVSEWSEAANLPKDLPYGAPQIAIMAVLTLLLFVFMKLSKNSSIAQLGLRSDGLAEDLKTTGKWALILALFYVALGTIAWFALPHFVDDTKAVFRGFLFKRYDFGTALAVIIAFPVLEEIWFRGLLYSGIRKDLGRNWALVMSALIFGFAHGAALPLNQLLGGLVFAWAFEKRRGLLAPTLLHMLGNGVLFGAGLLLLKFGYV
ncbi:MAG: CPBP family intramembrane metalloprotease [Planctomycetes bacterium]|nr:CPBP family intramembrane metalloprotease [Planctomycetota bacterium]